MPGICLCLHMMHACMHACMHAHKIEYETVAAVAVDVDTCNYMWRSDLELSSNHGLKAAGKNWRKLSNHTTSWSMQDYVVQACMCYSVSNSVM